MAFIQRFAVVDKIKFMADLVGSVARSEVGATSEAVISINRITPTTTFEIGTCTFAASSMNGVFASTGGDVQYLEEGDELEYVFPDPPDATLSDVAISLRGILSCVAPGPSGYTTGGVFFDGVNDFLELASLSATDSSQLLYSYWFKDMTHLTHTTPISWASDFNNNDLLEEKNYVEFSTSPSLTLQESTFSNDLAFKTNIATMPGGVWHHILVSVDVNFGAGSKPHFMYLDNVDVTTDVFEDGGAFTLVVNGLPFSIMGSASSIETLIGGNLADFWWGINQFLDISIEANRRKFISALGKPVDLGADGSTPTGTPPTFYLRRAPSDVASTFANDLSGNGNTFTITGTLTNAADSPSD